MDALLGGVIVFCASSLKTIGRIIYEDSKDIPKNRREMLITLSGLPGIYFNPTQKQIDLSNGYHLSAQTLDTASMLENILKKFCS